MNEIKKTKMKLMFKITFLSFFLMLSCEYRKIKENSENFKSPPKLSKEEMDSLSFQKVMNEVIDPFCISCHRENKDEKAPPLVTYQNVLSKLSEIKSSVFEKGTMPKKKKLSMRARSLLFAWIEAGAPEYGAGSPPSLPPPLLPQFSSIRDRIFNVRCGNCHNPESEECRSLSIPGFKYGEIENPEEGGYSQTSCHIELNIYNELVFGIDEEKPKELVIPGDPENSQLLFDLIKLDDEGPKMPPKEKGYSPLSEEEVNVIKEWIGAGALNN